MSSIVATIQEIIRHELKRVRIAELGVVTAVYPHSAGGDHENYGCDVRLKNSGLELKRVPVATGHIGTAAIPNIDDLVLLAFDKGDVNQPIIIGRLYNDEDRPPLNNPDEVIFRLPLHASDDEAIKARIRNHRDQRPPREILIEMAPKITVRINDGTVTATAGQTEMKLDQPDGSGGTVTVVAGNTKIVMNQDGDVEVEALGAMTLKAQRDLTLEGMNVKIKGQMNVDLDAGAQAGVKANMGATINGGLSATLQGASVSIKGITSFSP
ncbi:phage baseplate assembly protein V [Geoalkalibacter halelectricus]|uniref:Phage baseplate assembly protein V n=1 Tax=Geoalkalibacter halelectricus TaxID=2847045 RepID=A0ABY5ZQY3_9BACT|nr:phage baseplate assembly protein V [Geoalkalibacter halelectricus]MDO3379164.1 phage baseplate assembly protein V [Geoalkalibacter halelectricus]UWZ80924.1 phage baseplate assembly protein V [Geoalkalibacter halelectricus]